MAFFQEVRGAPRYECENAIACVHSHRTVSEATNKLLKIIYNTQQNSQHLSEEIVAAA